MWLMDKKQLKALKEMPDSEIDTSDIPEITNWDNAVVGKFHMQNKTNKADTENPEWVDKDFKKAKPASEVMPELMGCLIKRKNMKKTND